MNIDELLAAAERLDTCVGKAFLTERVVLRGRDLHHELGDHDWFRVFLFAITGREFTDAQLRVLNAMWVFTSYPDASIWPNQVAALAGSARTTPSLALIAGLAISEAKIYGRRPEQKAMGFFRRAVLALDSGESLDRIVEREMSTHKIIYGYGRPLAKTDERVIYTLKLIEELHLDQAKFFQLAMDIYHYLKHTRGLAMNVIALNAATFLDMGINPEECQLFTTAGFITGMVPCFQDARAAAEGAFFPMRCDYLSYSGREARSW